MRTRKRKVSRKTFVIFVVILIAIAAIGSVFTSFNDHTYIATVTDKERIVQNNEGEMQTFYLIFCKDDEGNYYELKNEDNLLRLKFNSSSVYNQIEVGETYQFTVVGFRIGLFSMYENIIEFQKVT